jgi:hypothetical protein
MFGGPWLELIFASRIDSNLKLGFVVLASKRDLRTQIYYSIHFHMNVSKYNLTLYSPFNWNQFYKINFR